MKYAELIHLLKTEQNIDVLDARREEIAELMPSIRVMFDFDQKNAAHQYNLWKHCLHVAIGLPRNLDDDMLYLAALVHDIGKPDCQVPDRVEGERHMHYPNHPERSAEILLKHILPELESHGMRYTEAEHRRFYYYVYYHDERMKLSQKMVNTHLDLVGKEVFQNLMILEVADAVAHVQIPIIRERVRVCSILAGLTGEQLQEVENLKDIDEVKLINNLRNAIA